MYCYVGSRRTTYYLISPENERINLGHDLDAARAKHREIMAEYQEMSGSPSIDLPEGARHAFLKARASAKVRNIAFSITPDDVTALMQETKGYCAVTGTPFSERRIKGKRIRPFMPSIDRIDSTKGYEPGNIRLVTSMVNIALNQFGDAALLTMLQGYLTTLSKR